MTQMSFETGRGVQAAVAAAKKGTKVFLAAPRPYLGEDMCAPFHLWLDKDKTPATKLGREIFSIPAESTKSSDGFKNLSYSYNTDVPSAGKHKDTKKPSMLFDGKFNNAAKQSIQYDDDVVNVSGHRIGTAEVESALVSHGKVAEAAVVPMPHDIKGQALYAFVTLVQGVPESDELKKELVAHVRKEIGPIASPDKIQFAPALPKTRSGKIMRRILRKIAENAVDQLGDITTLADSSVVDELVKGRQ